MRNFSWGNIIQGNDPKRPDFLEDILQDSPLLFLGYRSTDLNLFRFFNRGRGAPGAALFEVESTQPPGLEGRRAEVLRALSQVNIRPIWYPNNEPAALEILLSYLDQQVNGPSPPIAPPVSLALPEPPPPAAPTPPRVPPELLARCLGGECVPLVGSGLSARSGLPTWGQLVGNLLDHAVATGVIPPERADAQRDALLEDRNVVADNVVSAFQKNRDLLIEFGRKSSTGAAPSDAHRLLPRIPSAALLTSNLDDLLEQTYQAYRRTELERAYTPLDAEDLLGALSSNKPFLLKLYGALDRPESVIFSPAEYKAMISRHVPFTRFMEGLFFSRTLLFIGCSLEGITDFLNSFPFRSENPRRHYALVGVFGSAWRARAEALERRYNIEVIAFDASPGFQAVDAFLSDLAASTEREKAVRGAPSAPAQSRLREAVFRNIGPFEELVLRFEEP